MTLHYYGVSLRPKIKWYLYYGSPEQSNVHTCSDTQAWHGDQITAVRPHGNLAGKCARGRTMGVSKSDVISITQKHSSGVTSNILIFWKRMKRRGDRIPEVSMIRTFVTLRKQTKQSHCYFKIKEVKARLLRASALSDTEVFHKTARLHLPCCIISEGPGVTAVTSPVAYNVIYLF